MGIKGIIDVADSRYNLVLASQAARGSGYTPEAYSLKRGGVSSFQETILPLVGMGGMADSIEGGFQHITIVAMGRSSE